MPDITKMKPHRYILMEWYMGAWAIVITAPEGEYDTIRQAITKIKAYTPRRKYMVVDHDEQVSS